MLEIRVFTRLASSATLVEGMKMCEKYGEFLHKKSAEGRNFAASNLDFYQPEGALQELLFKLGKRRKNLKNVLKQAAFTLMRETR
jgi:hypothetical protein